MGVTKLFQDKNQYGSGVSQEVCRHDKEPYISTYLETGDEPVEKDSLESQIGNIQAQALNKQPCHRRQTETLLPASNTATSTSFTARSPARKKRPTLQSFPR